MTGAVKYPKMMRNSRFWATGKEAVRSLRYRNFRTEDDKVGGFCLNLSQ